MSTALPYAQDWLLYQQQTGGLFQQQSGPCQQQPGYLCGNGQCFEQTTATANDQWFQWNVIYYSTASTDSTDSTLTFTNQTWGTWNTEYIYFGQLDEQYPMLRANILQPRLSQAEIDLRIEQTEKRLKAEREAREKAARLLRQFLDAKQCDTLDKHRWFEVVTPKGRVFRITHGRAGNVYLIEGGRQVIRYCIHPVEVVPDEDTMLAQLLMLKTEEERFEETANKTRLCA